MELRTDKAEQKQQGRLRQIAVLILKNLFNIDLGEPKPAPKLERLILLWNQIEEQLSQEIS
jgi:hypothetical protein